MLEHCSTDVTLLTALWFRYRILVCSIGSKVDLWVADATDPVHARAMQRFNTSLAHFENVLARCDQAKTFLGSECVLPLHAVLSGLRMIRLAIMVLPDVNFVQGAGQAAQLDGGLRLSERTWQFLGLPLDWIVVQVKYLHLLGSPAVFQDLWQ
jgi:hypothetical protein